MRSVRVCALTVLALVCLAGPARAAVFSKDAASIYQLEPTNPSVGGFDDPEGVATSPAGQAIYVVDAQKARVVEMTSYGSFVRTWGCCGTGTGKLVKPTGIATDSRGNVYVADNGRGLIDEYQGNGAFIRALSVPAVFGVAVGPTNVVYGATRFFNVVVRMTAGGHSLGSFAPCPVSEGGDLGPVETCGLHGIATGPSGAVYALVNRQIHWPEPCAPDSLWGEFNQEPPVTGWAEVDRLTPDGGAHLGAWEPPEHFGDCYHGYATEDDWFGVAVDPNTSDQYAAHSGEIIVFSATSAAKDLAELGRPTKTIAWYSSLTFDCASNLYVTAVAGGAVVRYRNLVDTSAACRPARKLNIAPALVGGVFHVGKKLSVQLGCRKACRGGLRLTAGHVLVAKTTARLRKAGTVNVLVRPRVHLGRSAVLHVLFTPKGLRAARLRTRLRLSSALTLHAASTLSAGHALSVTGTVSPARRGRKVVLVATGARTIVRTAKTNGRGRWKARLTLPAGVWKLAADLDASRRYQPARARSRTVTAGPLPPTVKTTSPPRLTLSCPAALTPSAALTARVTGPPLTALRFTVVPPGQAPQTRTAGLDAAGRFAATIPSATPGTWELAVEAIGGTPVVCRVPVRTPESLSLTCPHSVPLPGGSGTADLSGVLTPAVAGATITVSVSGSGGARNATAAVAADGSYTAHVPVGTADVGHPLSASASFAGDATHAPASSGSCQFNAG